MSMKLEILLFTVNSCNSNIYLRHGIGAGFIVASINDVNMSIDNFCI